MQNFYWHSNLTLTYSGYRICCPPSSQTDSSLSEPTDCVFPHLYFRSTLQATANIYWAPHMILNKSVTVPRLWELTINHIVCVWWVELNLIKRKPRLEQVLLSLTVQSWGNWGYKATQPGLQTLTPEIFLFYIISILFSFLVTLSLWTLHLKLIYSRIFSVFSNWQHVIYVNFTYIISFHCSDPLLVNLLTL